MRRRVVISACAFLFTLATAGEAAAANAPSPLPRGFAGVVIDGPVWPTSSGDELGRQLDLMVASGIQSVRAQFDWASIQPYRDWATVPAAERARFTDIDGLPLDLSQLDLLVGACAERGLVVQPLVADAPGWDALPTNIAYTAVATPRDNRPYARLLTALIHRYGPRGSLWATHAPALPIRSWQVWNEPNLPIFWVHQPNFAPSYASLLHAAHDAIKAADPGASVVLAGLPNASWVDVAKILRVRGAARWFEIAAVHPYTRYPQGVLTIITLFRHALDAGGAARRPIVVDEFGWNSSQGHHSSHHFGAETTEHGQALYLGQAIPKLAAARARLRLLGFDYYDWARGEVDGADEFAFAGLFRDENGSFVAKPAYFTFRRTVLGLERCRRKALDARRCAQPIKRS